MSALLQLPLQPLGQSDLMSDLVPRGAREVRRRETRHARLELRPPPLIVRPEVVRVDRSATQLVVRQHTGVPEAENVREAPRRRGDHILDLIVARENEEL